MRWIVVSLGICFAAMGVAQAPSDADDKLLQNAQVAGDGPGLLAYLKQRQTSTEIRDKVALLITSLGDNRYAVREQATGDLIAIGMPAVQLLRAATRHQDIEVVRRAEKCLEAIERVPSAKVSAVVLRRIAQLRPADAAAALVEFLPIAESDGLHEELRNALSAVAVRNGVADPTLEQLLADPQPARRLLAGEALARNRSPLANRLLTDPDPTVRLQIAYAAVIYGKDKAAVAALIARILDAPPDQAWMAEEALIRLAGDAAPPVSLGKSEAERRACHDAWAGWWANAAEKVDLSRLEATPRFRGLTLCVALEPRTGAGRVFEIDHAGVVQWAIARLNQPSDAVVIGPDRVLIAERGDNRVTKRNFRGEVLWAKEFPRPLRVQHFPGGGLLIVAQNQIVEWDEKQKEVFAYQRERFDIANACKDRTGEYVVVTTLGDCLRISKTKAELKKFRIRENRPGFLDIDPLVGTKILMTYQNGVGEFDTAVEGSKGWSATVTGQPSSVQRIYNGHTLVAGAIDGAALELDRQGKIVWEYRSPDGAVVRKARRR